LSFSSGGEFEMIDRRFEYIRNQITDEILMEQQKSKILMEQQKSNNEKIQQLKEDIALNKEKLQKLEELQRTKSPVEEAFKKVFRHYPNEKDFREGIWFGFEKGYNASQEPKKEQKWDVVRESVKWCEEHQNESVEDYLTPQGPQGPVGPGPKGVIVGYEPTPQTPDNIWCLCAQTPDEIEENLREAFKKVQQTEEWKETQRKIDSNYDEMVESETSPQEPTSTVFRQKLFDGIKSVFYDPDYERTHWKLKVDMAVDEVLTHFYDIIPEPFEKELQDDFEKGWNSCLKSIEVYVEFGDD
jgi:hypothetical protein